MDPLLPVAMPDSEMPRSDPAGSERGFTLLEVMVAFAILALAITMLTSTWGQNIEKAIHAIDQREMRELADTVFGKILFEQQKHRDNDTGSMAVMYGEWARLPQDRADRYRDFYYHLRKQQYVAAGPSDPNDSETEELFGSDDEDEETVPAGPSGAGEEQAANSGIVLVKFTMRVYRQSEPDTDLIVLTRFLRPPDIQGGTR